jgi:formylglycine-generating enzyme required for sulfatase activity
MDEGNGKTGMVNSKAYTRKEFKKIKSIDNEARLPVMLFVSGGAYLMGTSDDDIKHLQLKQSDWAYDWSDNDLFEFERPQHACEVGAFEISQFPVTNLDYCRFTNDTGYRLPRTWKGFSFPDDMADHPVTGISRVDALAFIAWLNTRTKQNYRLPTEQEWEAAARGKDGRIYPWGNTFDPWRCNTSESAKKGTTPVGIYSPGGDSPCGAADMVGNVWEWTDSVFQPYFFEVDEDEPEDPMEPLHYVVRGGAWYYSRKLARCAVREGMQEDYTSHLIGFRLARNIAE